MMKLIVTLETLQMCLKISRIHLDQGWQTYGTWKDFLGMQHSLLSQFFISFARPMFPYFDISVYIYTSYCIETVYELPLLPNNTVSETFLHKLSGAKSWLDIYHWDASLVVIG
jgi:hypothetical protein